MSFIESIKELKSIIFESKNEKRTRHTAESLMRNMVDVLVLNKSKFHISENGKKICVYGIHRALPNKNTAPAEHELIMIISVEYPFYKAGKLKLTTSNGSGFFYVKEIERMIRE